MWLQAAETCGTAQADDAKTTLTTSQFPTSYSGTMLCSRFIVTGLIYSRVSRFIVTSTSDVQCLNHRAVKQCSRQVGGQIIFTFDSP